jgi:hypothetical protein
MPLSINPFIKNVITETSTRALTNLQNRLPKGPAAQILNNGITKAVLDKTIKRISGGIGSALNGAVPKQATDVITALSGKSGTIQSAISAGSGTLVSNLTTINSLPINQPLENISQTIVSGGLSPGSLTTNLTQYTGDVIQAARSANLPDVTNPSVPRSNTGVSNTDEVDPDTVVRPVPVASGDWRVRISAPLGWGEIVFPVLPNMTLSHKANYKEEGLVHTNYLFLAYKNSQTDDISISCEWPVETVEDAEQWIDMVLLGRTLTKMFYGSSSNLGNPPPICTIRGYAAEGNPIILPETPVVVKSFSVDLKDDVNYLKANGNYVPRLSNVSITVGVIYNRNTQRAFNLSSYRSGSGIIKY